MRLDPQHEHRWAPLERLLGDVATMKLAEAGPQRSVAGWGLVEALRDNDPNGVAAWLARGADANLRGEGGRTPLFEAALPWKDPDIAEHLLARGADVRAHDEHDRTPLHVAAFYGGEARIGLFLDHGAEIDARDAAGRTPLHCAASLGRLEEATILVSRGADVSIRDHEGRTPWDAVRPHYEWWNQCGWKESGVLAGHREAEWEQLQGLLGGFTTVKVIGARADSLIIRVEGHHGRYPDAEREAKERDALTIPTSLFRGDIPEQGACFRCERGLLPVLDEVWREARRRDLDLGIELTR